MTVQAHNRFVVCVVVVKFAVNGNQALQNMISKEVGPFFELRDLSGECVIVVPEA